MTASIISAAAMVIVAIIEAVAARDRKRDKQERAQMQERQELQEQLMLELIKGNWASVAGEATAKAVQRIPDAHCNGDMHAALDYASQIKHEQKEFLTKRGIHAILGSDEAA